MKVLIYEDNLLWSVRFAQGLKKLGHDAQVVANGEAMAADAAIVNLGHRSADPRILVGQLQALGVKVIGHAGHKEKDLHALGREAGCDVLATNGQITHKLQEVLDQAR